MRRSYQAVVAIVVAVALAVTVLTPYLLADTDDPCITYAKTTTCDMLDQDSCPDVQNNNNNACTSHTDYALYANKWSCFDLDPWNSGVSVCCPVLSGGEAVTSHCRRIFACEFDALKVTKCFRGAMQSQTNAAIYETVFCD